MAVGAYPVVCAMWRTTPPVVLLAHLCILMRRMLNGCGVLDIGGNGDAKHCHEPTVTASTATAKSQRRRPKTKGAGGRAIAVCVPSPQNRNWCA